MIRVPAEAAKSTNIVMGPASNWLRPVNFRRIHQRLVTVLTGLTGIVIISIPSVLTGTGNSILKCRNVFCSPGDTTEYVIVELDGDCSDSTAGIQFDLYADPRYFTPLDSEPWDIYGLRGWLHQTAIRNDSMVAFIAADSLLNGWRVYANLAYNYYVDKETPSGFYLIQPASVMISGISGDSVGCQAQSGTIIVAKGDVYVKIADDCARVGQQSVVIPITFVSKEGARSFSFEIADTAGILTLREISLVLPIGWITNINQDSSGTISVYASCNAPPKMGYPIEANEIRTFNLIVDIDRNASPGTYLINAQNVCVGDAIFDSGPWTVESIAGRLTIIDSKAAVQSAPFLAGQFSLSQNYPNPFNLSTTIGFTLAQPGTVQIEIYNLLGQSVRTFAAGNYQVGVHSLIWDGLADNGAELNSGIYFYRLSAAGRTFSRKMVLIK